MMKIRPISRRYDDLVNGLTILLAPYNISTGGCDVFEETLLWASGVKHQPSKCYFSPAYTSEEDGFPDYVKISIAGINQTGAEQFLNFLKTFDENAVIKNSKKLNEGLAENQGNYKFIISTKSASKKILPGFEHYLQDMLKENPNKLIEYQEASKHDENLQLFALLNDCQNIEEGTNDKFVAKKIHSAFELLTVSYNNYLKNSSVIDTDENLLQAQVLTGAISLMVSALRYYVETSKREVVEKTQEGLSRSLKFFQPIPLISSPSISQNENELISTVQSNF